MTVYDDIKAYHEIHGDDINPGRGKTIRYEAALSLFPRTYDSLLDCGCGTGGFKQWWGGTAKYTGIDLLNGINVLDYNVHHDVVIALGMLYLAPPEEQLKLIEHMWGIADKALIVQTLTTVSTEGEYGISRVRLAQIGHELSKQFVVKADYWDTDGTLALYRQQWT